MSNGNHPVAAHVGIEGESEPRYKKSKLISIRVETEILDRLRELAQKKQQGYQTLLKQFLVEKLVEEERRIYP